MKRIKSLLLAGLCVLPMIKASAFDDGDSQLWVSSSFTTSIAEKTSITISQEFRFGDDMSDCYDVETYLGFTYKVNDAFNVAFGHLHVEVEGSDEWKSSDIPTLDFIFKQSLAGGWKIDERFRVEYYFNEDAEDYDRYRFRVKLTSPWSWTSIGINPYVAVEPFYYSNSDSGFNRVRYYLGANMKFTDHISGNLFYLLQRDDRGSYWRDYNVLGFYLGVKF
ncbi:MAG: DUF2490 domain-containing protein [Opitutales bacterium]|nr:DUF2490 domain-containing protein [Opitutales bacterium]